jgi:hypothetical protein
MYECRLSVCKYCTPPLFPFVHTKIHISRTRISRGARHQAPTDKCRLIKQRLRIFSPRVNHQTISTDSQKSTNYLSFESNELIYRTCFIHFVNKPMKYIIISDSSTAHLHLLAVRGIKAATIPPHYSMSRCFLDTMFCSHNPPIPSVDNGHGTGLKSVGYPYNRHH